MSSNTHFYEPRLGHGLPHDPFNAIVGPRPIGWISTRAPDGGLNLAPYSFFSAFNYVPPIIGFASIGAKDTLRNIEATGEFGWSLATQPLAEAMNQTSASVPPETDEFVLAGLTPAPSHLIRAPRVTSKGKNTNAQFGFTNTLVELITKQKPSHLAVCFDTPHGAPPLRRHPKIPTIHAPGRSQAHCITLFSVSSW